MGRVKGARLETTHWRNRKQEAPRYAGVIELIECIFNVVI
jgi:hypothetical protein